MSIRLLTLILASVFCLSACDGGDDDDIRNPTTAPAVVSSVVDVAQAQEGEFNSLVAALQATGLDATLDDPNAQFTVFAPTDAAFEQLGEETLANLFADTETLSNILLYHVIQGSEITADQAIASAGNRVTTANGQDIALSLSGSNLLVNLPTVTATDIQADNGIIHVIDTVLTPPTDAAANRLTTDITTTAVGREDLTTLVTALQATGLDTALSGEGPFTVFAPTDTAFAALPEGTLESLSSEELTDILQLHVIPSAEVDAVSAFAASGTSVSTLATDENGNTLNIPVSIAGSTLTAGGATVSETDIYTSNGVIHVIDSVILSGATPTPVPSVSPEPTPSESPAPSGSPDPAPTTSPAPSGSPDPVPTTSPVPSVSPAPTPSETPDPSPSPTSSLSAIQTEIFSVSCALSGCHTGPTPPQGLLLDSVDNSFNSLVNISSNQVPDLLRVEPNDDDDSYLVRKIEGGPEIQGQRMPFGGQPLSTAQIQQIRDWIEQGAPLN